MARTGQCTQNVSRRETAQGALRRVSSQSHREGPASWSSSGAPVRHQRVLGRTRGGTGNLLEAFEREVMRGAANSHCSP